MSKKIHQYEFGGFCLDLVNCRLLKNQDTIHLAKKTFRILTFFVENAGQMIRKEEFLERFWEGSYMEETNLAQHIYRIRKALDIDDESKHYIETIPKFGYRFVGEVGEKILDQNTSEISKNHQILINEIIENPAIYFDSYNAIEKVEKKLLEDSLIKLNHSTNGVEIVNDSAFVVDKKIAFIVFLGFILTLASGYFYFLNRQIADVKNVESIAVLPFQQIGEKKNEELGLGLADTIISRLSNQKKISVSPTSTIVKFTDKENKDPIEIGKSLKVNAVLTGTIQRSNEMVRVNVQLIDVNGETSIWSEKFDARFLDIFSLQDRISDNVAETLSLDIPDTEVYRKTNQYIDTKSINAYQAYTIGLFYWGKRDSESLMKAINYFQKAIDYDTKFAKAYAMLADTYTLFYYNRYEGVSSNEALIKGKQNAEKALQLHSQLSEALTALALIHICENKGLKAYSLLLKAINVNPNNATANHRLASIYAFNNNLENGIITLKKAERLDPQSVIINRNLAIFLSLDKKDDEALIYAEKANVLAPSAINAIVLANIYEHMEFFGKSREILKSVLEQNPQNTKAILMLARINAKLNEMEKARKYMKKALVTDNSNDFLFEKSLAYLYLGETDKAISSLESLKLTPAMVLLLRKDRNLNPIRKTDQFKRILDKIKNTKISNV